MGKILQLSENRENHDFFLPYTVYGQTKGNLLHILNRRVNGNL